MKEIQPFGVAKRMKRSWRRREEAVSPVIATILLVAITVVLAAVLYILVIGATQGIGSNVMIAMTKSSTDTNWTFTVQSIQGDNRVSLVDIIILVKNESLMLRLNSTVVSMMIPGFYYDGVRYIATSGDGYLHVGDLFTLDRMIYKPGSTLMLTDSIGHSTYASYQV